MKKISDIETSYRQYEQDAIQKYIEMMDLHLNLEELREEYPDIAIDCDSAFKELSVVAKDIVDDEKYNILLKHHTQILISELAVDFILSPLFLAIQKMEGIKDMYQCTSSESKYDYLQKHRIKYRELINEQLQTNSTSLLASDYGWQEIFDTFNVDDTSQFQELLTAYFIAFFCDYYSRNEDIPVDEALIKYSKAPIKTTQSFEDIFKSITDWANISNESEFDLLTFAKKDLIIKMMEDLSITNNGEYIGSDRSKSRLLGFVKACQEKGLLPDDSTDKVVENLAHHIKMQYSARLQESTKSERAYYATINHIKRNNLS